MKSTFWGGALPTPQGSIEERKEIIQTQVKGQQVPPDTGDEPVTTTVSQREPSLPTLPPTDFNFCTEPYVYVLDKNRTLDIPYQCDGPRYRSFMTGLRKFINDLITSGEQSPTWGHQRSLPENKKYLFFGNSHTRQVAMQMLCQLNVQYEETLDNTKNLAMARRYDMDNGAQVYLVINSYVVHSPQWPELLALQTGVKLDDFDAVILGMFNRCHSEDANTTFAQLMLLANNSDYGVDCSRVDGPSLKEVAAVYTGPLLYVSMFATYRAHTYLVDLEDAKKLRTKRPSLMGLSARHYIKDYGLPECGSAKRDLLLDCTENEDARRHQHRCVGQYGGHPDLIAWDVIEFLYDHT